MNVLSSSCEVPVILVRFSNNRQISHFMEIGPVRTELLHADREVEGRADRHEEAANHLYASYGYFLYCTGGDPV